MPPYRRSIFLINKPFQFRFSLYVCSWLLALSFVYPLIVYNLFEYFVRYASLDPNGAPVAVLQDTKHQVLVLLGILQLVFLVITFLISIFMSHRIAGPLYKLKRFFSEAAKGNLNDSLAFREKDHFKDVAVEYNAMIRGIRGIMEKNSASVATAAAHVEHALTHASPETRHDLETALSALRTANKPPVAPPGASPPA